MTRKNNKKGFTLVELVIVVAVMAVLVAVAIPTIATIRNEAQDAVNASNARTIESTIKLAEAQKTADNTTDAVAALDEDEIKAAIDAAKLGITTGVYNYNATTGVVVYDDEDFTPATGSFILSFGANGVTVTKQA